MSDKKNVYDIVTEKVLELLDKNIVPWHKPWRAVAGANVPVSVRGHKYRGINVFLLSWAAQLKGYQSPIWMTYKQAQELGGKVRPGEKSTLVTFWKMLRIEELDNETLQMKVKRIPLLRYFLVFNFEQTDGVKLPKRMKAIQTAIEEGEKLSAEESIAAAEAILSAYETGPQVVHLPGVQAQYSPLLDTINIARKGDFESIESYYATRFHEEGHGTGHEKRCARKGIISFDHFGSGQYAEEELVAELTSAFLQAESGITTQLEQSAAYIQNWRQKLSEDPKLIVHAAAKAQKAADFILGTTFEEQEQE